MSCTSRHGLGMNSSMWGPLVGRPEVHRVLRGRDRRGRDRKCREDNKNHNCS